MTQPQCPQTDLGCPQPENYAAIAKQLHETALEVEDRIFCLEQLLRGAVNMPAYVETSTAIPTAFSADSFSPLNGLGTPTTNFRNSPYTASSTVAAATTLLPAGAYHVGQYFNATPTGAATANTYRLAQVALRETVTGIDTDTQVWEQRSVETSSGSGGDMTVSGVVRSNGRQRVVFGFQHGNTGSTMQINIGAVRWVIRLSDSTTLRVV